MRFEPVSGAAQPVAGAGGPVWVSTACAILRRGTIGDGTGDVGDVWPSTVAFQRRSLPMPADVSHTRTPSDSRPQAASYSSPEGP